MEEIGIQQKSNTFLKSKHNLCNPLRFKPGLQCNGEEKRAIREASPHHGAAPMPLHSLFLEA